MLVTTQLQLLIHIPQCMYLSRYLCATSGLTNTLLLIHNRWVAINCELLHIEILFCDVTIHYRGHCYMNSICNLRSVTSVPMSVRVNETGGRLYWFHQWEHGHFDYQHSPDSKVRGANMGPICGRQDPGGPHVRPMNFAIWVTFITMNTITLG